MCGTGKENTKLFLQTNSALIVKIDAATEKASITMANGKVFPLQARDGETKRDSGGKCARGERWGGRWGQVCCLACVSTPLRPARSHA